MIFVDMDGVLANFVAGACKAHGKDDPYLDPANSGKWNMWELFGMTKADFWTPLGSHEFWSELKPTKEFESIISTVNMNGEWPDVWLSSSPTLSSQSYSGKYAWIEMHLPGMKRRLVLTQAKSLMARPDRILIDDGDNNVNAWIDAGGRAILFPRPWNARHKHQANFDLKKELDALI